MASVSKGVLAGLAGTAVMTAAQALEMRLSGRPPSMVPGQVASRVLHLEPRGDAELSRISTAMHWAHGAANGAVRAGIGAVGLSGLAAAGAHFSLMWTHDAALYKTLGVADWPWRWSAEELAPDLLHKGIYVVATSLVYDRLK